MVTDVAIVGGGLTGCSAAYLFAAAGIRTCLLEAGQVGQGGSAEGPGVIRSQPWMRFEALQKTHGRRAARQIWESCRHASLDLASLVRRLKIRCDLEACDWLTVAFTPADLRELEREHKAAGTAGLDPIWFRRSRLLRDLALEAEGGIRIQGGASIDPYRATLGMAKAAVARGARLFERSPVVRIRADRAGVEVETDAGSIAARAVVVATGAPGPLFAPLKRHFRQRHEYVVVTRPLDAAIRRQLGRRDVVLGDAADASRIIGRTRDDRLVVAGGSQAPVAERRRAKAIVQRTGQLMYELSLVYPAISGLEAEGGWDTLVTSAPDGLPIAGPHRNYPHHLFALGSGPDGPAASLLASRILFRHFTGAPEPGDELYGFGRR